MAERAQFGLGGLHSYPGSGNYQLSSFTQLMLTQEHGIRTRHWDRYKDEHNNHINKWLQYILISATRETHIKFINKPNILMKY